MQNGYHNIVTVSRRLLQMLIVLALATLACDSVGQTPATAFTQPFDYTKTRISILPQSKWGVFRAADTVTIATSNNLPITVYDLYGRTVYTGSPVSRNFAEGHYFVECNGDRNQFCVLPNNYTSVNFLGDSGNQGWDVALRRDTLMGVGWRRIFETDWQVVQANSGQYDWSLADGSVTNKLDCSILLRAADYAPSWVTAANFMSAYTNYVTTLARRYKGQITAIELWNEPGPSKFPAGVTDWRALLVQILIGGAKAVRAVDPSIKIVGPAWWSVGVYDDTAYLRNAGALSSIDVFSWHDYSINDVPPDVPVTSPWDGTLGPGLLGRVSLYRQAIGTNIPLYTDEIGLFAQSALGIPYPPVTSLAYYALPPWQTGMNRTTKLAVLYRAAGIEALTIHMLALSAPSPNEEGAGLYGWEYNYRGPAPKTTALLMTSYWLNGARLVDYRTLGQWIFLFAWTRPDNTSLLFAWTAEGKTVGVNSAAGLTATDIFGDSLPVSTLTEVPILFRSNSSDAAALLRDVISALSAQPNLPPVVQGISNQTVMNGQLLQFVVSAIDSDNDPIRYSVSPLPTGASFDAVSGLFSWEPSNAAGGYQLTFTATDARGLSSSTTTTVTVVNSLLDGRAACWKFDEGAGSVATDSVGNNNGTLLNFTNANSGWVTGKSGSALSFDGLGSYVSLSSSKLTLTNNFAISAWVYPRNAAKIAVFLALRSTYQVSGLRLFVNGNSIYLDGQTTKGWQSASFASGAILNNNWYHVVLVYDKSTIKAFLNGVYLGSVDWGGDIVLYPTGGTSAMGMEGSYFFNGILDEVMVFNRTLSPAEVMALYRVTTNTTPPRAPSGLTVTAN